MTHTLHQDIDIEDEHTEDNNNIELVDQEVNHPDNKNSAEENNAEIHNSDENPVKILKRPSTAYFIFMNERRTGVRADNPGATIGTVGKILGQKWQELAEEEKTLYQNTANRLKEEYNEHVKLYPELYKKDKSAENEEEKGESDQLIANLFPAANVLRIIKSDPDVKKVTKEAVTMTNKCTQLFIADLAQITQRSHAQSGAKSQGIRFSDIFTAIRSEPQLDFLRLPMKKFLNQLDSVAREMEKQRKVEREKRKAERMSEENNNNDDKESEGEEEEGQQTIAEGAEEGAEENQGDSADIDLYENSNKENNPDNDSAIDHISTNNNNNNSHEKKSKKHKSNNSDEPINSKTAKGKANNKPKSKSQNIAAMFSRISSQQPRVKLTVAPDDSSRGNLMATSHSNSKEKPTQNDDSSMHTESIQDYSVIELDS
jgi:histone H3/H4